MVAQRLTTIRCRFSRRMQDDSICVGPAPVLRRRRHWDEDMGLPTDLQILGQARYATQSRREALFRETPFQTLQRWVLGTAWTLKPSRVTGLPALAQMWLADLAAKDGRLPDPRQALSKPPGLCGIVHDLSVPTLVEAYRRGLFTFAHLGPLKWMSPPERCVLSFDDFHMSKRLRSPAAAKPLPRHFRPRLRVRDQVLCGSPQWQMASDLDHAADHARLLQPARCRLCAFVRGVECRRRAGRRWLWCGGRRRVHDRIAVLA